MNEVMNTEKGNPYSFYVVLADGITAVPQSTFLWRMCWKTAQASTVSCFMILPIPGVSLNPRYLPRKAWSSLGAS